MRRALMLPLILLPTLPGCALFAGGRLTVTTQPAGCSSLIPADWANGTPAAEIPNAIAIGAAVVADWQTLADREAARGDVADDRTKATIHIVTACEARDAAAVHRATRGFFGRLFGG